MPSRRRPVGILPNGKRAVPNVSALHGTPLPYGWILSDQIKERLQYESLKRVLTTLAQGETLEPHEEGFLVEAFDRIPDQEEAVELLEWVKKELND